MTPTDDSTSLAGLRRLLGALLTFGLLGTGAELLLLEHHEDSWQLSPLVLIGLALLVQVWHLVGRGPASLRAFRVTLVLLVADGLVGLWQHYTGNAEFELEMYPTLAGADLFVEALGGATPVLAPGTMILLGLLGLLSTWRSTGPTLRSADPGPPPLGET